jgi:hypothetical protein
MPPKGQNQAQYVTIASPETTPEKATPVTQ